MTDISIVDLNEYGLITVGGPDAATFLQGQLTCDIKEISEHTDHSNHPNDLDHSNHGIRDIKLGAFCNQKGRIRALFRIFLKDGLYFLQLPKTLLPPILKELKKYGKFSKVIIVDKTEHFRILGLIFDTTDDLNNIKKTEKELKELAELTTIIYPSKKRIEIIGIPEEIENFYQKLKEHSKEKATEQLKNQFIISKALFSVWTLADINEGLPEVYLETTEQLLPHHVNLPQLGGVSFTKGCYCGQEIIARMQYRGNIKRHMVKGILQENTILRNHLQEIPPAGSKVYSEDSLNTDRDNTDIGMVISASFSNDGQIEMLLELPKEYSDEPLQIEKRNEFYIIMKK